MERSSLKNRSTFPQMPERKISQKIGDSIKKIFLFLFILIGFILASNVAWIGPWTSEPDYWRPHLAYSQDLSSIYITTKTPVECVLEVHWAIYSDEGIVPGDDSLNDDKWIWMPSVRDVAATITHELLIGPLTANHSVIYYIGVEQGEGESSALNAKIVEDLSESYVIPAKAIVPTNFTQPFDLRFGVYGDNRPTVYGTDNHKFLVESLMKKDPQFVLQMGDLVQTGGNNYEWARFFYEGQEMFRRIPILPTLGNHEYYAGNPYNQEALHRADNYIEAFTLPENESYYSYNISRTHFIVLDFSGSQGSRNEEVQAGQMAWLDRDLAAINSSRDKIDWVIMSFHYPIESSGEMHTQLWDKLLKPVCLKYDIVPDLFLVGHVHQYERVYLEDAGAWQILNAGGGAEIEQWKASGDILPNSHCIELSHSYSMVNITYDFAENTTELTLRAYYMSGIQFDSLTLNKTIGGL